MKKKFKSIIDETCQLQKKKLSLPRSNSESQETAYNICNVGSKAFILEPCVY